MLTITQDWTVRDGRLAEHAKSDGHELVARERATCQLASMLIREGYSPDCPVRIVRGDPLTFPPPHRIEGVSLRIISQVDFFNLGGRAARQEAEAVLNMCGR